MPKRILKVHRTLTFLTQKKKFINFGFKSKYKNRESWNKTKDKLTADDYKKNVAKQMLVLTVVNSAINFLIVLNRSHDCLRVL
jgi:hypothetical protein